MKQWLATALAFIAFAFVQAISFSGSTLAQGESQAWPQRAVRFLVPFGPGSAADISARVLAERLQKTWGKPAVVENKPGGDGLTAIGAFVSAKDEHILLMTPTTVFLVHPYLHETLPYDPDRDLQPISWVSAAPLGIAVTSTLPVTTLKEFVDYAKRLDGKVNYGVGVGFLEFVWDGFRREHAVPMTKVPFRDIVQAPLDLGEGRIDVLLTSVTTHRPMLQSGKTKLLAINDPQRSEFTPGVPTVIEAGYPSLQILSMYVLFGPSVMALPLRERVSEDIAAALREPEVAGKLRGSGQQTVGQGPVAVAKAIAEQHAQVARIAQVLGMSRRR